MNWVLTRTHKLTVAQKQSLISLLLTAAVVNVIHCVLHPHQPSHTMRTLCTPHVLVATPVLRPLKRQFAVYAKQSDDEAGVNWDEGGSDLLAMHAYTAPYHKPYLISTTTQLGNESLKTSPTSKTEPPHALQHHHVQRPAPVRRISSAKSSSCSTCGVMSVHSL